MIFSIGEIFRTAVLIAVAGIPLAGIGLMFLHAARAPQWVWALAGRRQVVWLALLLGGAAIIPLGVPLAIWYAVRVRPEIDRVERGDLASTIDRDDGSGEP